MEELNNRINELGPKETISKSTFVDILCKVWHQGLKIDNICSGFRTTGVIPTDRSKYPSDLFDPRLLKRYEKWVESGKPGDLMDELDATTKTRKRK